MIWFAALLGILAIGLAAWWFQRQMQRTIARAGATLTEQAQQVFAQARQADAHAMAMDKQKIDGAIQGLEKQLSRYEHLVKEFEKDRDQQYGKLTGAIDRSEEHTSELGQT